MYTREFIRHLLSLNKDKIDRHKFYQIVKTKAIVDDTELSGLIEETPILAGE